MVKLIQILGVLVIPLLIPSCFEKSMGPAVLTKTAADTLAWQDAGLVVDSPLDTSDIMELKRAGLNMLAKDFSGHLYLGRHGSNKWKRIYPPKGTVSGYTNSKIASDGQGFYIVTRSPMNVLYSFDPVSSTWSQLPIPDSLRWCPKNLPADRPCHLYNVFYSGDFLFMSSGYAQFQSMPTGDTNVRYFMSRNRGADWEEVHYLEKSKLDDLENDITQIITHGNTSYFMTAYNGIRRYRGGVWDSMPQIHQTLYIPRDTLRESYIDTTDLFVSHAKLTVLNDTLYGLSMVGGDLFRWNGSTWTELGRGYFWPYGADTVCGKIYKAASGEYWDMAKAKYINVLNNSYIRSKIDSVLLDSLMTKPPGYDSFRIGDSLYVGRDKSVSVKGRPGRVEVLNLRNMPWCADAWARGAVDRK